MHASTPTICRNSDSNKLAGRNCQREAARWCCAFYASVRKYLRNDATRFIAKVTKYLIRIGVYISPMDGDGCSARYWAGEGFHGDDCWAWVEREYSFRISKEKVAISGHLDENTT